VLTDPYVCAYRDRTGRTVANDRSSDWIAPAFAEIYRAMKPDSLCVNFYGWGAADAFPTGVESSGIPHYGPPGLPQRLRIHAQGTDGQHSRPSYSRPGKQNSQYFGNCYDGSPEGTGPLSQ
jgi:hypothetical protein